MIRFIDIGNQIGYGVRCFSFYNTVNDRFINLNGNQVWDNLEEFSYDYLKDDSINRIVFDFDRFLKLMASWVPEVNNFDEI